jgi:hypothetical protein
MFSFELIFEYFFLNRTYNENSNNKYIVHTYLQFKHRKKKQIIFIDHHRRLEF